MASGRFGGWSRLVSRFFRRKGIIVSPATHPATFRALLLDLELSGCITPRTGTFSPQSSPALPTDSIPPKPTTLSNPSGSPTITEILIGVTCRIVGGVTFVKIWELAENHPWVLLQCEVTRGTFVVPLQEFCADELRRRLNECKKRFGIEEEEGFHGLLSPE